MLLKRRRKKEGVKNKLRTQPVVNILLVDKLAVADSNQSAVKGVLKTKVTITKMMTFFFIITTYSWMFCCTLSESNT